MFARVCVFEHSLIPMSFQPPPVPGSAQQLQGRSLQQWCPSTTHYLEGFSLSRCYNTRNGVELRPTERLIPTGSVSHPLFRGACWIGGGSKKFPGFGSLIHSGDINARKHYMWIFCWDVRCQTTRARGAGHFIFFHEKPPVFSGNTLPAHSLCGGSDVTHTMIFLLIQRCFCFTADLFLYFIEYISYGSVTTLNIVHFEIKWIKWWFVYWIFVILNDWIHIFCTGTPTAFPINRIFETIFSPILTYLQPGPDRLIALVDRTEFFQATAVPFLVFSRSGLVAKPTYVEKRLRPQSAEVQESCLTAPSMHGPVQESSAGSPPVRNVNQWRRQQGKNQPVIIVALSCWEGEDFWALGFHFCSTATFALVRQI